MVIPHEQDGKTDDCPALRMQRDANEEVSSRVGGIPASSEEPESVIVDMREFRCELPAILYTRGMRIEPVTLQV